MRGWREDLERKTVRPPLFTSMGNGCSLSAVQVSLGQSIFAQPRMDAASLGYVVGPITGLDNVLMDFLAVEGVWKFTMAMTETFLIILQSHI